MPLSSLIFVLSGAVFAASGQILFKLGADGRTDFLSFINLYIALGFLAYAVGALFWIFVLSREPLIVVYPFTVLTFVLVYLGGIWLLGEPPSTVGLIGVVVILFGQFLVFLSSAKP